MTELKVQKLVNGLQPAMQRRLGDEGEKCAAAHVHKIPAHTHHKQRGVKGQQAGPASATKQPQRARPPRPGHSRCAPARSIYRS